MQTQHFCPKAFQGIYLNAEKYLYLKDLGAFVTHIVENIEEKIA